MFHYIIQTIAFQLFFLIIYDVFLKKETFFNWNRAYLLVTAMLSLIIPFIKINSFKNFISQDYIINLPEVFIGNTNQPEIHPVELNLSLLEGNSFWSWEFVFYLGVGLATLLLAFKLAKLAILLYKNPKQKLDNVFIISLLKSKLAFSFFNYIFLGEDFKNDERTAILKHEMVHVKQNHTLDLLFFELLRILFWFNP
ncbi:MAG: blaR1 peptidase M56 family protein, partial [Algibacter sp.]